MSVSHDSLADMPRTQRIVNAIASGARPSKLREARAKIIGGTMAVKFKLDAALRRMLRESHAAGVMPVDAGVSDDDMGAINARRIVTDD